jgi:hypothetical protein
MSGQKQLYGEANGGDAVTIRVPPPPHFIARPLHAPQRRVAAVATNELTVVAFATQKALSNA